MRELHVYGTAIAVHSRDSAKFQHQGYGSLLMAEAERIASQEHRSTKLAVISGVGTRHYYRYSPGSGCVTLDASHADMPYDLVHCLALRCWPCAQSTHAVCLQGHHLHGCASRLHDGILSVSSHMISHQSMLYFSQEAGLQSGGPLHGQNAAA